MSDIATIDHATMPDLAGMRPVGIDLVLNYWTPSEAEEYRDVIFMSIKTIDYPGRDNPEVLESRPTAILVEQNADGTYTTISNSSSRLISALQPLNPKTPIRITYKGKQKNSTNSNMSDSWSIHALKSAV